MAVKLADAVAYLRADTSQLDKDLGDAEGKVSAGGNRFGSVLQGIGISVGMGLANIAVEAVGRITAFMGDSITAASDMGETISRTNVLFGESAAALLNWAEAASSSIGQSKQQALDGATTFATFGRSAGLAGDDLVGFSTGLTELATDLASFNNTSPEDAIEAIGAALRGEAEPMRRYGVLLDDATLKAEAMKLGIYDGTGALTAQQKVLAAQAAIYAQTSAAQGDFERTSGGLANQQRILDAQMENLKATIGEALLPIVLALVSALNNLVQAVLPPLTNFIRNQVVPVMTMLGDVINRTLGPAITAISQAFQGFGGTLDQQRNGPMAYLARWFQENMPRIQLLVERVVGAITSFWEAHGERIMAVVRPLLEWLIAFWDTQLRTLLDVITVILQLLVGDFEGAGQTLQGIFGRWGEFISSSVTGMVNGIRDAFLSIDWMALGRAIIEGIGNGILNSGGWLQTQVGNAAQGALDAAKNALGIGSPSRVAADEIGVPFVEGIGMGLQRALGDLSGSISAGMSGLVAGMAGQMGPVQPVAVTLNIYGGDATTIGGAARDGILSGLRAAGLR